MTLKDKLVKQFIHRTGQTPDTDNPATFNEKILYRKLHDRRPILGKMTDKIRARKIAKEKCPDIEIIPYKLIKQGRFSFPFVVKPSNKSGQTRVVKNEDQYRQAISRLEMQRHIDYGHDKGEWAYSKAPFVIYTEPLITGFTELHMYCFHGRVEMILIVDEYEKIPNRPTSRGPQGMSLFDRGGRLFDACIDERPVTHATFPDLPIKELVSKADRLSKGMDFVRVDLLYTEDNTYFSEYTFYPASGCYRWRPVSFDKKLGGHW